MTGWLRALRVELRRGLSPWAAVGMALVVAAFLWLDTTATWGGRWNSLGQLMRESMVALGPLCVTLGTWQGGRSRRAGIGELLASTSGSALRRNSVSIAALSVAIAVGTLCGWASGAWTIVAVGGWGSSAAAYYLIGLLPAILAYTALGFAIGSLAPWRIVAPMTGVAAFVLLGFVLWDGERFATVVGTGWLGGTDGHAFDLDAWAWSCAVLLAAAVAVWALASRERRPGAARAWLPIALTGLVGAGALFPLGVRASDPYATSPAAEPLACSSDLPEVCVFPEDRLLLDETTAAAQPVLRLLADVPGAPNRAAPSASETPDPEALYVHPGDTTAWGDPDREWDEGVYVGTSNLFSPYSYCGDGNSDAVPPSLERAFQAPGDVLSFWLNSARGTQPGPGTYREGDATHDALATRFAASTDAQRRDYAGRVLAAARACDEDAAKSAADALAP